jgi:hypothetical protein
MTKAYYQDLLQSVLKPQPTYGSVLQLFADSMGAMHYLLVELPIGTSSSFIVTSNLNEASLPIDDIIANIVPSQVTYPGFGDVDSMFALPVTENLVAILINPTLPIPDDSMLLSTRSVISYLHSKSPFDIDFSLSVAAKCTEVDLSSFSPIETHPSQAILFTVASFTHTGLCQRLGVDPRELFPFLVTLRSHYNNVPYHNWEHALDATQFVYTLYQTTHVERFLTDIELFALLLATICHDTDHNGLNNNFHRNANTPFAHLAPSLPPLEHHHCCISCDLVRPLLAPLPEADRLTITHFMIDCIMATDMEKHGRVMDAWAAVLGRFDQSNPAHRLLLAQIIIKAADLCNVIRDFPVCEALSSRLAAETRRQGQREIELGLPISPMCNPDDPTPLCVGQVGFYAFVAGPLMRQVLAFLPEFEGSVKRFDSNLERWKAMKTAWEATVNPAAE